MSRERAKQRKADDEGPQMGLFRRLMVDEQDIGAELLPILSKGLYTNPLDCIREYVQNGVDANATEVTIQITGNSVYIHDNGDGMDEPTLVKARALGSSWKRMDENVGFRGIGIYSAYDLCNRLQITTKRANEGKIYILRFNFAAMRDELARARAADTSSTIALSTLLHDHTDFGEEETDDRDAHFTVIQLEELSDTHIRTLADRDKLRHYVLHNLPVDFAEAFPYREIITNKLRENVPGFKAVKITLKSDGLDDDVVAKPAIENLLEPTIETITAGGKDVAYFWACLTSGRGQIGKSKSNPKASSIEQEYQGFATKYKGFTIGNRDRFRGAFSAGSGTLYGWYTGEIYVIDPRVVPNAERDDFEASTAKVALEAAVVGRLAKLATQANKARERARAAELVDQWAAALPKIESDIQQGVGDQIQLLEQLLGASQQLEKQKSKIGSDRKEELIALVTKAKELKKSLESGIGRPARAPKKAPPASPSPATPEPAQAPPAPTRRPEPEPESTPTLIELAREYGFESGSQLAWLLQTIDNSLIDVLGVTSSAYKAVVHEVEQRCQEEMDD